MACRSASSIIEDDCVRVKTTEKDAILIQKGDVGTHIPQTDNENSYEEKYSSLDETVDTDEYEEEDTRFLDVCMDGDIEDLVQLLEEMAQAGETLGADMLNCADTTGRVSKKTLTVSTL